ncbi:MAG: RNA polymerase sigma factor [Bacteroidota bacterium]
MHAADEQLLILQAKEQDAGAFRTLVERYMKQTYNVAFNLVRNHEDAEDVAQEAFVRIYRSLEKFRGDSEFSTWLYRITVNVALDRIKQRKKKDEREVRNVENMFIPMMVQAGDNADVSMHIERALHELPTLQRAVVILRHINGLPTKKVGEILQCSEGTVKTHLHRGLKKMKEKLDFLKE